MPLQKNLLQILVKQTKVYKNCDDFNTYSGKSKIMYFNKFNISKTQFLPFMKSELYLWCPG